MIRSWRKRYKESCRPIPYPSLPSIDYLRHSNAPEKDMGDYFQCCDHVTQENTVRFRRAYRLMSWCALCHDFAWGWMLGPGVPDNKVCDRHFSWCPASGWKQFNKTYMMTHNDNVHED